MQLKFQLIVAAISILPTFTFAAPAEMTTTISPLPPTFTTEGPSADPSGGTTTCWTPTWPSDSDRPTDSGTASTTVTYSLSASVSEGPSPYSSTVTPSPSIYPPNPTGSCFTTVIAQTITATVCS
ncbi:hypothetical protein C8Q75DRAFT_746622 [Abortiporus biennis]|nr:hypothetical protein C8Q75DRAFT_746622 [Abortiporus biennis]